MKLTKLTENKLAELEELNNAKKTLIESRLLPHEFLLKTEMLLKSIDPNDTPFVALANHLQGRLWTGDMQLYNGLKSKRFKEIILTAEVSLLLDDLERD